MGSSLNLERGEDALLSAGLGRGEGGYLRYGPEREGEEASPSYSSSIDKGLALFLAISRGGAYIGGVGRILLSREKRKTYKLFFRGRSLLFEGGGQVRLQLSEKGEGGNTLKTLTSTRRKGEKRKQTDYY